MKVETQNFKRRVIYVPDNLWKVVDDLEENVHLHESAVLRGILVYYKDHVNKKEILDFVKKIKDEVEIRRRKDETRTTSNKTF